ncbi:hypothetical protein ABW20_dc0104345 [Dactylellina cionopaga]|nr:hypothetical protein ABW20_dc0104345 [Dactylellina cionopaga]
MKVSFLLLAGLVAFCRAKPLGKVDIVTLQAPSPGNLEARAITSQNICSSTKVAPVLQLLQTNSGQSLCSNALGISTQTSYTTVTTTPAPITVTRYQVELVTATSAYYTVTQRFSEAVVAATSTSTETVTIPFTSIITSYSTPPVSTSTSTIFTTPGVPPVKRSPTIEERGVVIIPTYLKGVDAFYVLQACSCWSLPTSTVTSTRTVFAAPPVSFTTITSTATQIVQVGTSTSLTVTFPSTTSTTATVTATPTTFSTTMVIVPASTSTITTYVAIPTQCQNTQANGQLHLGITIYNDGRTVTSSRVNVMRPDGFPEGNLYWVDPDICCTICYQTKDCAVYG